MCSSACPLASPAIIPNSSKDDDDAVRETANYIALLGKNYPQVLIGDIEPYRFIPLADQLF